jgi:hypothetical protein
MIISDLKRRRQRLLRLRVGARDGRRDRSSDGGEAAAAGGASRPQDRATQKRAAHVEKRAPKTQVKTRVRRRLEVGLFLMETRHRREPGHVVTTSSQVLSEKKSISRSDPNVKIVLRLSKVVRHTPILDSAPTKTRRSRSERAH